MTPAATRLEVKRAYRRLLMQHRPDGDPEGFQRIRAAYEQLVNLAQERTGAAPHRDEVLPAPVASVEQAGPATYGHDAGVDRAWDVACSGDTAGALDLLDGLLERDDSYTEAHLARLLIGEVAGDPSRFHEAAAAALWKGSDRDAVVAQLAVMVEEGSLVLDAGRFGAEPQLCSAALRRLHQLFERQGDPHAIVPELKRAQDELCGRSPGTWVDLIHCLARTHMWSDPYLARQILEMAEADLADCEAAIADEHDELALEVAAGVESWRGPEIPPAVLHLLAVQSGGLVPSDRLAALRRAALRDGSIDRFLRSLHSWAPTLEQMLWRIAGTMSQARSLTDVKEGAASPPGREVPERRKEDLVEFLKERDRLLGAGWGNWFLILALLAVVGLIVVAWIELAWKWALPLSVLLPIAGILAANAVAMRLQYAGLRPALRQHLIRRAVPVGDVVALVAADPQSLAQVAYVSEHIEGDLELALLTADFTSVLPASPAEQERG